jgi:ADP-ribosylation factor-like protein 3
MNHKIFISPFSENSINKKFIVKDFIKMSSSSSQIKRRVPFLGLDNAGKTTILKSMCQEEISTIAPTRGFNVKQLKQGKFQFNIWDIGGQKALRAFWSNYYDQIHGVVWVIDSAESVRMKETGFELAALLQDEKLAGVPLLVLANKQDLISASTVDEVAFLSYSRLLLN